MYLQETFEIPDELEDGKGLFLSIESIMCAPRLSKESPNREWLIQLPLHSVQIAKPSLDSTMEESQNAGATVSSAKNRRQMSATTSVHKTPAMQAAKPKNSGKSTVSEGLTTVGTNSSSLAQSAPGTANSPASSENSSNSSSRSSSAEKSTSNARKPNKELFVGLVKAGKGTIANTPDFSHRVAGPSNMANELIPFGFKQGRGVHDASSAASDHLFRDHWNSMKRFNFWKHIYWKGSKDVTVYIVPLRDNAPHYELIEV